MRLITFSLLTCLFIQSPVSYAANPANGVVHNVKAKTIIIETADKSLSILIDYNKGCFIKRLLIKGQNTLSEAGVYTGFRINETPLTSSDKSSGVKVAAGSNSVSISNISFGQASFGVTESWSFDVKGSQIIWKIHRENNNAATLQDMAMPKWNFASLSTWKGGILDNGGMVWCKYLKENNDTYGVHTSGVTYWNTESGNGLGVAVETGKADHLASKYSNNNGSFTATQLVTYRELGQRYDLSRFVHGKHDVFAPFKVEKGNTDVTIKLNYVDYFKKYSRGNLPGIDSVAVRELMNTTGRYGVVDNKIIGANGWLTNWKCLHEPFFAQIGLALNDANYTRNFAATLDQERDLAVLKDGRVLSRWHNAAGDEIPGTYDPKTGYYEAMWGYTMDSQPDQVINTCEQFNLTGDVKWLRSHQKTCEKALDWLIKRDSNNNGIFEMMNSNIQQKKASDWLDIVWASYENGFVNAQMYEALNLWANCEKILKNDAKADKYLAIAAKLKHAFNKPTTEGGFWSEEKKQYVYWRDDDGSVHGDNLVTPVNFAVLAFNLCDDQTRRQMILNQIEDRTVKENLFHWPLCFDSFKQEEVSGGNWPFPKYENGDIFPTWGYLGVRAYSMYNPAIAIKYIKKLLAQYRKDGLSSQRYSRTTQLGLGDDILAGICTGITALYSDIYGVSPKWNRMGLEPKMISDLNGTRFPYTLRDTLYNIELNVSNYTLSTERFKISAKQAFGASNKGDLFAIYPDNKEDQVLYITSPKGRRLRMKLDAYKKDDQLSWTVSSKDQYAFLITGLAANATYQVTMNDLKTSLKAGINGSVDFHHDLNSITKFSITKVRSIR
jgi:hypothetical protein